MWRLVEQLDEQREQPRIDISAKARIQRSDDAPVSVAVVNISPDGLQLRCDSEAAQKIHPEARQIAPGEAHTVRIAVGLPVADGTRIVTGTAQLLYFSTVDTDPRCVIGVKFAQLDENSEQGLAAFFADQLGY